ncbi:protein LNK1-like isoform X2 [Tasmannia lanceolata]|uniref:protein LNK1-like isoform X2 n=1 Tax=Tasmannia lanceolata TaxID=3420 RepID=UPI004063C24C
MSDWGMYGLEDIVWDKFGVSDDHIVPHPGGEHINDCVGDCHKKSRHEIANAVGRSTDDRKPASKNVFQGKETTFHSTLKDGMAQMLENGSWPHVNDNGDSNCINVATGLGSEDSKISDNCFKSSNVDTVANDFCTDDLEFFGNEHESKKSSDLLDYGWPDIGNFEDVDRMFRNCDSTFGQGSTSTANELSWFSASSHGIDGPEDDFKLGFRSSCSESNALKITSKYHETDMKFMPGDQHPLIDCDTKNASSTLKDSYWTSNAHDPASHCFGTYANWWDGDAGNDGESALKDQSHGYDGGDKMKITPVTEMSHGSSLTGYQGSDVVNMPSEQSKSQSQSEGKRKYRSSECLSGTCLQRHGPVRKFANQKLPTSPLSVPQSFPSQKQLWEPNSSRYPHTFTPYMNLEYSPSMHQRPTPATQSCVTSEKRSEHPLSYKVSTMTPEEKIEKLRQRKEKIEKLRQRKEIRAQLTTENQQENFTSQSTFTNQTPVQRQTHHAQEEVGGDSEVEETGMELPAVEVDSSTVQESSFMGSVLSGEISLEATCRPLQDVIEQLDIRTKLCIRDSLYRLARSAEQRHNFCNTDVNVREGKGKSGVAATEASNKCMGFIDTETGTNPIDRSIVHLLFYRPSEPSTGPANDDVSLESHIIHGSISSQPVMPDQMVCHNDIAGDTD